MSASAIRVVVHEAIRSVLPGLAECSIDEEMSLKDLGADSIDRIEIISAMLGTLNLKLPMSAFSAIPNVRVLIETLSRGSEGNGDAVRN